VEVKAEKIRTILKTNECHAVNKRWYSKSVDAKLHETTKSTGLLSSAQNTLKRYGQLYRTLLVMLGPVLPNWIAEQKIHRLLSNHGIHQVLVNLGSGPANYFGRKDIINVDLSPFENVDLVSSADALPIQNESVDLIINVAMLEHARNPTQIIDEMLRILKPGGIAILFVPFLQPFHAAPSDFGRWTNIGAKELVKGFKSADIIIGAGPTSSLLWIAQHWLALLFSFGIKPIHDALFILLMLLTFPLKYLDYIFVMIPGANIISSGFYIIARK